MKNHKNQSGPVVYICTPIAYHDNKRKTSFGSIPYYLELGITVFIIYIIFFQLSR
jgi:hypothetical protein